MRDAMLIGCLAAFMALGYWVMRKADSFLNRHVPGPDGEPRGAASARTGKKGAAR